MKVLFIRLSLIAATVFIAVSCGAAKEDENDAQIRTFLTEVSFSYDSLETESVRRVQEMLPEQSCIVYATDVGCSSCISQIIKDLKSMSRLESDVNVWIVSTQETNTMLIDYYLSEKKEDFGLTDLGFRYYVIPDMVLDGVVDGLYLFRDGRPANVLRN